MVSIAQTSIGARGAKPISAPIFIGVVRVLDFALLLFAAWLSAACVVACFQSPWRGPLVLAAIIGAATGCAALASKGAYTIESLRAPRLQMWPSLKAVALADAAVIACLFLVGAQTPPLHAFPLAFAATALLLLASFRLSLAVLVDRWMEAGRFRRRIAVVAVSDFSREFIERLRAEPDIFEIAGVYDDRLKSGRVPSLHANVPVRGSVADLVRDSREEKVDIIAVALPLSAAQRIADVLEKLSSTVADLCLTKAGFDYVVGAAALIILSPLLALLALAVRLDSKGPILFRQPRLGFNNRMFVCYKYRQTPILINP
jgi:polysaccharide biosynthesis protein PslA